MNARTAALAASRLGDSLAAGMVLVALPLSTDATHAAAPARAGVLVSTFGLALAAVQPLAGKLADGRFAPRTLAVAGLVLFAAATALLGVATAFEQLVVLRVLQAVAIALTVPTTASLVAAADPASRGAAFGLCGSVRMLGFTLGPVVGGAVIVLASPATVYLCGALLALASALVLGLSARDAGAVAPPPRRNEETDRLGPWLVLGAAAAIASGCATSLLALEPAFLARPGLTPVGFGLAVTAMLATRLLLEWPMGRLSDRLSSGGLVVAGLLVLGPATALLAVAASPLALVLVRVAMGVGMALFAAPALALAASGPASGAGARLSAVTTGSALGVGLGPLAAGAAATFAGPGVALAGLGGLAIAGALAVHIALPALAPARAEPTFLLSPRGRSARACTAAS